MNQESFVAAGEPRWERFEALLVSLEKRKQEAPTDAFPQAYRAVCRDLALARQRRFDAFLVDRLNRLALRGHQIMYRPPTGTWSRIVQFCLVGFPRAVRAEAPIILLATFLFYGSALAIYGMIRADPDSVYTVLGRQQVAQMEAMYNPESEHHLRPRGSESDFAMFGFYIKNNMGVGFQTFAGGVFAGIGSLLFLIYNGIFLGAVAGHLTEVGFHQPLFSFVIGHGAPELTAIVFSAAAGLRLGWALLAPGPYSRSDALVLAGRKAIPIVYGSTGLFLVAAGLEAFWSANVYLPYAVKYGVGALLWVMLALYLLVPGRGGADGY